MAKARVLGAAEAAATGKKGMPLPQFAAAQKRKFPSPPAMSVQASQVQ
jgi:hypothetical protein